MKPYYEHGGITIYHGDCREILPCLTADAVVTDPPYGLGFDGQPWDSELADGWLPLARTSADTVVFTTAPTTLWSYPRPDWVLCLHRQAASSRRPGGAFNHWTPVLVYGQGNWTSDVLQYHAPNVGRQNKGIDHPCPKPELAYRWLIAGCGGASVIDPFIGSGTTLVAAKDLGRRAIGIELEEKYCEIAAKRLSQEVLFGVR